MKCKFFYASILAMAMSACGNDSDYRSVIPSRAAAVVSVDLNSMSEKAGLSGNTTNSALKGRLKSMFKSGLTGADALVDKLFDNISESGLGLTDKVYVFAGEQAKTSGILVKVDDEDKLEDLLGMLSSQHICDKINETDGCKWTSVGNVLLAYKSHAMLLVIDKKSSSTSSLLRKASMWLRQEDGEGFSASDDFRQMSSRNSDIVAWNSLEVFSTESIYPIVMGVSAELSLKNVKAISTVDFEKGKVKVDIETVFDDKIMDEIMEKKGKVTSSINGEYIDMFPSNTPFWAAANIKGGDFFDFICENPVVRRYFEKSMLPVDFASVFDAIEGDVVLALSGNGSSEFIAFADVKSSGFLQSFESLKSMAAMSGGQVLFGNHGENGYEFKTYNGSIVGLSSGPVALWIGVKDNKLYITNKESLIDRRVLGLSLRNKPWGERVKGQKFFMASDLSSLEKLVDVKKGNNLASTFLQILGKLDYFTVESPEGENLHIEIVMKDTDKNPLSVVLNK